MKRILSVLLILAASCSAHADTICDGWPLTFHDDGSISGPSCSVVVVPPPDPDPPPPDPDPTPDPDPVPPPDGAPYDVGATPFAFSWPQNPQASQVIVVSSADEWAGAVASSGAQIIVAENLNLFGVTISGSDLDIYVPNSTTITDRLTVRGDRIRWVGGNIAANNAIGLLLDGVNDVLFDNVRVIASSTMNGSEGVSIRGFNNRVAFINSTIEATGNDNVWAMHTLARGAMNDLVLANVRVEQYFSASQRGAAYRFNPVNRLIVVDSIFNGRVTNTGTGMRLSGAQDVYWRDVINVGMIHTDFVTSGGVASWAYDVQNLTVDNLHTYNPRGSEIIQGRTLGTGTVSNSTVHSGGFVGSPRLGPMQDGGGNTSVSWDGSTIDYTDMPGKTSISDYGADH